MKISRKLGYSLFGGGGAAGTMLAGQGCLGACTGCLGCVAFSGLLVTWALATTVYRHTRVDKHELAAAGAIVTNQQAESS